MTRLLTFATTSQHKDCHLPPRRTLQAVTLTLLCTLVKTARSVLQSHVRNHHVGQQRTAHSTPYSPPICVLCPCSQAGSGSSHLKAVSSGPQKAPEQSECDQKRGQSCWEKTVQVVQRAGSQQVFHLWKLSWVGFSTQKRPCRSKWWRSEKAQNKAPFISFLSSPLPGLRQKKRKGKEVAVEKVSLFAQRSGWGTRKEETSSFTESFPNSSKGDSSFSSSQLCRCTKNEGGLKRTAADSWEESFAVS